MADLTPERIAELRRIAEAATKGPWEAVLCGETSVHAITGPERIMDFERRSGVFHKGFAGPDALHITTFSPPTVLELLDEIERLRQEREQTLFVLDQAVNGIRWWMDAHPESASGADDEWLYEAEQILRPGEQQEVPDDA